ncbi:MAG TPA: DUF692 domain-containing protein [Propylenella sp.]|nr:DUF692 domain-containing protein [Propylenella sp.]
MLLPMSLPTYRAGPAIPPRGGIGLKAEHFADISRNALGVAFFEIHAENYMGEGGPPHAMLSAIRDRFPLSVHGVGLSIGGAAPINRQHLARLQRLVALYRPGLFSEHLAWSSHNDAFLNDLLPLPYNDKTLERVVMHVDQVQNVLGMKMLLENPSTYVAFENATMGEIEFLAEVVARTRCGLLLDVNNVHVSANNLGFDPFAYIDDFPVASVGEIHLGGHSVDRDEDGSPLLIDAHGTPVADPVWALFEHAIERTGPVPTLIEWDNDVPAYSVLAAEAARADAVIEKSCRWKYRLIA